MPKFIIKEVERLTKDINFFADIVYKNFLHLSRYPKLKHNKKEIVRLLQSYDMVSYFVYNAENVLIAYLIGERKTLDDGRYVFYISYLYVAKRYRKHGIGGKLIDRIKKKFQMSTSAGNINDSSIHNIVLTCDTRNKETCLFYRKRGFMPDPTYRTFDEYDVYTAYI